jgi:hypothetical protein
MATFQHHFLFVSLVFYRLANAQITNDTQKEGTDGRSADKKNVSSTRQTTIRPSRASSAL